MVPLSRFRASVFYTATQDGSDVLVTVWRVLHQRRDLSATDFE